MQSSRSNPCRLVVFTVAFAVALAGLLRAGLGGGPTPVPRDTATRVIKSEQLYGSANP